MPISQAIADLREENPTTLWKHEEHDFTPWLLENLDRLSEALGIELDKSERQREVRVGRYMVDIEAKETGSGRKVVIENQLTASDHSHLGQLLTYAAGREAATVIWLCWELREEHRKALDWLNAHTDEEKGQRGSACAKEGQRDARYRHGGCDNRDVDNSLARYQRGDAYGNQASHHVWRIHGNLNTAPDEKHEQYDNGERAHKAQLLGQNREDEVVVRLRNIQILLEALAKAPSEQRTGGNGIKGVDHLESASLLVFEGVQEGKESFGTVLTSHDEVVSGDQGRNGQDNKVTDLGSRTEDNDH